MAQPNNQQDVTSLLNKNLQSLSPELQSADNKSDFNQNQIEENINLSPTNNQSPTSFDTNFTGISEYNQTQAPIPQTPSNNIPEEYDPLDPYQNSTVAPSPASTNYNPPLNTNPSNIGSNIDNNTNENYKTNVVGKNFFSSLLNSVWVWVLLGATMILLIFFLLLQLNVFGGLFNNNGDNNTTSTVQYNDCVSNGGTITYEEPKTCTIDGNSSEDPAYSTQEREDYLRSLENDAAIDRNLTVLAPLQGESMDKVDANPGRNSFIKEGSELFKSQVFNLNDEGFNQDYFNLYSTLADGTTLSDNDLNQFKIVFGGEYIGVTNNGGFLVHSNDNLFGQLFVYKVNRIRDNFALISSELPGFNTLNRYSQTCVNNTPDIDNNENEVIRACIKEEIQNDLSVFDSASSQINKIEQKINFE